MKLPKEIKIGPHTYKARFEENYSANHGTLAESRHTHTQIVIDPSQSESQLRDTLLHEILHCINAQVGFVSHERSEEEAAVARLAPMLLQVIQDNPEIFTK